MNVRLSGCGLCGKRLWHELLGTSHVVITVILQELSPWLMLPMAVDLEPL